MLFQMKSVDDGTLHDFYLVDVHMHLGVDRGTPIRNYNRENFFKFCRSVEKAFFKDLSYASSNLRFQLQEIRPPEVMVGLPVQIGEGEPPPAVFDGFFVAPYVRIVTSEVKPAAVESADVQVFRNNKLIVKWSSLSGLRRFTPLKYLLPAEGVPLEREVEAALSREGYFGVKIRFDVLKNSLKRVLSAMRGKPSLLMVEMLSAPNTGTFLELLNKARLEMGDIPAPIIVNCSECDFDDALLSILSMDNIFADISGLDVDRLSEFIALVKGRLPDWSRKLLFGTNYPFCKIGDVVKVLKYLFSSDFAGDSTDLKRILGGNAVGLIPPHHSLLAPSIKESSILAIDQYSEETARIFDGLLDYFTKRGLVTIGSFDFLVRSDEGVIDFSKYFLTLKSTKNPQREVTFLLMKSQENVPRNALAITILDPKTLSEFKNRTIENISRNETMKKLLSSATLISSTEEINELPKMFASALYETETVNSEEVNVFSLSAAAFGEKIVGMNLRDMVILGLRDYDLLILEPIASGDWYAALVRGFDDVSVGELQVDEELMSNWYVFEGDTVKVAGYRDKVELLRRIDFAVETSEGIKALELLEKIKDKTDLLYDKLNGFFVGEGMRFILPELFLDAPFVIKPARFYPALRDKRLGVVKAGKTKINFVSEAWVKPYNLVFVINVSEAMKQSEITVHEFEEIARNLTTLNARQAESLEKFIRKGKIAKNVAAALIAAACLRILSEKSNLKKVSVVSYSSQGSLFTILEKGKVTPYMDFGSNRKNFSLKVLTSHILDKCRYPEGKANLKDAIQKVQEFTENTGDENPTLAVIITSEEKKENFEILQEVADKNPRIRLAVIHIDKTENKNELSNIMNSIKGRYIQIEKIDPSLEAVILSNLTELL